MRASQVRTEDGYPCCEGDGPITRPRASVHAPISGTLDQRTYHETDRSTGKQTNPALPWITTLLAGTACGLVIALCLLQPWEHSARVVKAELNAEFAQQLADLRAETRQSGTDSAIAKNSVQKLEARLNANR